MTDKLPKGVMPIAVLHTVLCSDGIARTVWVSNRTSEIVAVLDTPVYLSQQHVAEVKAAIEKNSDEQQQRSSSQRTTGL